LTTLDEAAILPKLHKSTNTKMSQARFGACEKDILKRK
jgi:hypothetical protein